MSVVTESRKLFVIWKLASCIRADFFPLFFILSTFFILPSSKFPIQIEFREQSRAFRSFSEVVFWSFVFVWLQLMAVAENPKALRHESDGNFGLFPLELIVEILSRLPVKVLGRFTTVCKLWYSLITSRMFIDTHAMNYSQSLANNAFISETHCANILLLPTVIKELETQFFLSYCDTSFLRHGKFEMPMVYHWLEIMYIGNSCNGIICLSDQKSFFGREVFLFNPFIKKLKNISSDCFADVMYVRRNVFSKLGFGYCEFTNDYKVVRIHYIKDEISRKLGTFPPEVEVYSLNSDRWRRITANVKCLVNYKSVSCNGSIYWLARRENDLACKVIMSFDMAREVFCEIGLPVQCNSVKDGTLLIYKGLLALFNNASREDEEMRCYELWVLNEAKTWIRRSILQTAKPANKAFGFTVSGKLVLETDCNALVSWDPVKDHLEHLNTEAFQKHVDTAFAESLVLYEGGNLPSAGTKTIVAESSQTARIMKPQESLSEMNTYMVPIHGELVTVRIAVDLAMVNQGVSELKNLCSRRPALVGYMARPLDRPSNLRLCVNNYCLIVQHDRLDQVPESLKNFLANPEICFMRVEPDRFLVKSGNLEKKGILFDDLVDRVLKKYYPGGIGLKQLGNQVGIDLEDYPDWHDLGSRANGFSEGSIKWLIYRVYTSYKIGYKVWCSLEQAA